MNSETKKAMSKVISGDDDLLSEKEKVAVDNELNSLHTLISDTDKLLKELDMAEEEAKNTDIGLIK